MWHKAIWNGHPMRLELTRIGLLVELANHYTTRGASELTAWQSLKSVVKNFLRKHWSVEDEKEIEELLKSFRQLRAQMSVKLHFLQSHYFPKNSRDFNEDQGDCFHQDICIMGECRQSQQDVNFHADYCLCLKWDVMTTMHRRMSLKGPLIHE